MTMISPIIALDIVSPSPSELKKSAAPTMTIPTMMTAMPTSLNHSSLFLRKILERMPTKTMMEPRNIWNWEALVRVRPTYIMEVAVTSHRAGGRNRNGLGLGWSSTASVSSSFLMQ